MADLLNSLSQLPKQALLDSLSSDYDYSIKEDGRNCESLHHLRYSLLHHLINDDLVGWLPDRGDPNVWSSSD